MDKYKKVRFTILTGPRRGKMTHHIRGPVGEEPRDQDQLAGGELRTSEGQWASILMRGQSGAHRKKCEGISLVHLNVNRSQSGENRKGDLWQKPAFPPWCTWSSGQTAHSQGVGMLRHGEHMNFFLINNKYIFKGRDPRI